ncbi:hypothetical protein CBR_g31705 [Chara braunii]|uniref:Uncharacterized protein n=1 Tax=Chara braunii TaxID=69332 RepID=A0A388JY03_CHABU|nr:hypothetical protein CBR_g31705 [Chara braunii]|eukprot:GBG62689.1 hypothetical protein CBR_g31705 [Chara braunii]
MLWLLVLKGGRILLFDGHLTLYEKSCRQHLVCAERQPHQVPPGSRIWDSRGFSMEEQDLDWRSPFLLTSRLKYQLCPLFEDLTK